MGADHNCVAVVEGFGVMEYFCLRCEDVLAVVQCLAGLGSEGMHTLTQIELTSILIRNLTQLLKNLILHHIFTGHLWGKWSVLFSVLFCFECKAPFLITVFVIIEHMVEDRLGFFYKHGGIATRTILSQHVSPVLLQSLGHGRVHP